MFMFFLFRVNYDVACPMTFHRYPYDTQECKVKYESCKFVEYIQGLFTQKYDFGSCASCGHADQDCWMSNESLIV